MTFEGSIKIESYLIAELESHLKRYTDINGNVDAKQIARHAAEKFNCFDEDGNIQDFIMDMAELLADEYTAAS